MSSSIIIWNNSCCFHFLLKYLKNENICHVLTTLHGGFRLLDIPNILIFEEVLSGDMIFSHLTFNILSSTIHKDISKILKWIIFQVVFLSASMHLYELLKSKSWSLHTKTLTSCNSSLRSAVSTWDILILWNLAYASSK